VNEQETTPDLAAEDRDLVDLLRAVLVDPSVHTDRRMRLHREMRALLRAAHEDLYGRCGDDEHRRASEATSDRLPDLLTTVLIDPNLHTDLRMRLHREIRGLLSWADADGSL
jgi:hypothetical protein